MPSSLGEHINALLGLSDRFFLSGTTQPMYNPALLSTTVHYQASLTTSLENQYHSRSSNETIDLYQNSIALSLKTPLPWRKTKGGAALYLRHRKTSFTGEDLRDQIDFSIEPNGVYDLIGHAFLYQHAGQFGAYVSRYFGKISRRSTHRALSAAFISYTQRIFLRPPTCHLRQRPIYRNITQRTRRNAGISDARSVSISRGYSPLRFTK